MEDVSKNNVDLVITKKPEKKVQKLGKVKYYRPQRKVRVVRKCVASS